MLFDFNGTKIRFQVSEENTFTSKHSGKSLQLLTLQTRLQGKSKNDEFLALLSESQETDITSIDDNGNILKRWKMRNNSWSYTDSSLFYYHSIEIEEVESLQISLLQVGEMTVQPYYYREFLDEESLTIEAKALLTNEQHALVKTILKKRDPITVIRHGIDERPRQMILNWGYWSKGGDQIKHEINLIDPKDESKLNPIAILRWVGPMARQVAENQALVDGLLTTLVSKSILSNDEATKIRNEAIDQAWENRYAFFRVDDIDTE